MARACHLGGSRSSQAANPLSTSLVVIAIPIYQIEKLRLGEVKQYTPSYTANKNEAETPKSLEQSSP